MRKLFFLAVVFLFFNSINAQQVRVPVSGAYTGLGAYSINHIDVFSITDNQASLAQLKQGGMGLSAEKRFFMGATNMYSAIVGLTGKNGNFAFQADYFGFKNYNEYQLGVAYARSLGSKLDIGIKFNYYGLSIPFYGNASAINFEAGVIAHLTDKLHAGFHVYNPAGGKISKTENEKLSSIYKFGVGYEASESFLVSMEIIKKEDLPVSVNAGFEYDFYKRFFVRVITSTATSGTCVGAGLSWKNLRLDVNSSYHPQLGFTPGILLIVNFKKQ